MDGEFEVAGVYALPLRTRFRRIDVRHGLLLRGPAGWGDFCPFPEYDDEESVPWLDAAVESAATGWPAAVRAEVPVNAIIPAVSPETAHRMAIESGSTTCKVKVAEPGEPAGSDVDRVSAVRDALGADGRIRVDANGGWDVDEAVRMITELDRAAGGLEYVEQPCPSVPQLAAVRRRVDVPIAADESIRRAEDPLLVARAEAADIAVLKAAPLGGVRACLRIADDIGLPCVVSSAAESGVGLAAGIALAAALPRLPYACGLGTGALFRVDLTGTALGPTGGVFRSVSTAPEPDPEILEAHRAPPDVRQWWLSRLERVALLRERRAGRHCAAGPA